MIASDGFNQYNNTMNTLIGRQFEDTTHLLLLNIAANLALLVDGKMEELGYVMAPNNRYKLSTDNTLIKYDNNQEEMK